MPGWQVSCEACPHWSTSERRGWIHLQAVLRDDISQEGDGGRMELALLFLDVQGVVQEAAENRPVMGEVLLKIAGKNLDVVQVHKDKLI